MQETEIVDAQLVPKEPKSTLEIMMWLILGLCGVAFLSCSGFVFLFAPTRSIESGPTPTPAKSQAIATVEQPKAETPREDLIAQQFAFWDGSHRELVRIVKDNMNDPGSFEHVETSYWDQGETILIKMRFRGKNGFGGVVLQTATGMATLDGKTELVMVQ